MRLYTILAVGLISVSSFAQAQQINTIEVTKAVNIFADICGGSLPRFNKAERRLQAFGETSLFNGQHILSGTSASLKVFNKSSRTCSVSFVTADRPNKTKRAIGALGKLQDRKMGGASVWLGNYRRKAVFVSTRREKIGRVTRYELVMLAPK